MSLNIGITTLTENLMISWETLLFLIITMGALIVFAKGFKEGLIILMLSELLLFMYEYHEGFDYSKPLTTFFICLVIMALSFFPISKTVTQSGGIS